VSPQAVDRALSGRAKSSSALSDNEFRRYLAATTINSFGNQIAPIALAFAVLEELGSASALSAALAARIVPQLCFFLIGGVAGDRYSRKLILITSNGAAFLAQGCLAALLLAGSPSLLAICSTQVVAGTAAAFSSPSAAGLLPMFLQRDQLQGANAATQTGMSTSALVGPLAGGFLVATLGGGWAIAIDALTFVVAAVLFGSMVSTGAKGAARNASLLEDLRAGARTLTGQPWIGASVASASLWHLIVTATLLVAGPVIAQDFYSGSSTWSLVLGASAAGGLMGALLMARLSVGRPLLIGNLALGLSAFEYFALGFHAPLAILIVAAAIQGASLSCYLVLWKSTVQKRVKADDLSRVESWNTLGSFFFHPLGLLVVGLAIPLIGASSAALLAGFAAVAIAVGTALLPTVSRLTSSASNQVTK
jgi:hypothetical protein